MYSDCHMFLALLIVVASARRVTDLRKRSLEEHTSVVDGPGYYLVQFRGPVTASIVRRLATVLGYTPTDYIPVNTLLLWLDSKERGDAMLRAMTQIHWIGPLNHGDRHRDMRVGIESVKTQYQRFHGIRLNGTTILNDRSYRSQHATFEQDVAGSLVVRLHVIARNVSNEELLQVAQERSRTKISGHHRGGKTHSLRNVHIDDVSRVADALSHHSNVQWVEMRTPHHPLNRWSIPTMQLAAGGDQQTLPPFKLRGKGQLISVSDTGVETSTCFFADPRFAVPFTPVQVVPADTGHRKVRAYWTGLGDNVDEGPEAEHGTHVVGTATGSGSNASAAFSGGAPDARLVFIDLLPASNTDGFLNVPDDLDSTLLQWSSDVGARVHSASWGGNANGAYTSDEQAVDRFMYFNRYFLCVFAAGNDGPTSPSISSPGMAKNALAVGATMNGIGAVQLSQTPSRPADDYSPDWLASFSSRGSATLSFRKPDVVAPGGAYVWSAANTGPKTGACQPISDTLLGLQGTSMATPTVSAAAILVREYFQTNQYPNRASITTSDPSSPTASLVRCMLIASTVPLRGTYPRTAFSSTQDRINAGGHGRIALDQVIDVGGSTMLAVLANEEAPLALAAQRTLTWCVQINGTYTQLMATMSYADYPSVPMAAATLINDLRLSVVDDKGQVFAVNEQPGVAEKRSVNERVIVSNSVRLIVSVTADDIGFGDVASFSLLIALRGAASTTTLSVSAPSSDKTCILCAMENNQFVPTSQCTVCGDGVVEPPEQCDSTTCCDANKCQLLNDKSPCTIIAGACRLTGTCQGAGGCVADKTMAYSALASGNGATTCQSVPAPPAGSAPCLFVSSSTWAARLAANSATLDQQLCCAPVTGVFESIEFEHLFALLAREYAAAFLNSLQQGVVMDAGALLLIQQAAALLETRCGVGFLLINERQQASMLLNELQALNEECGDHTVVEGSNPCLVTSLDQRLCSGGGTYDTTTATCLCHTNRQPTEPDCAHLGCTGNGVSIYNYDVESEQCTCLENWSGSDCSLCVAQDKTSDLAYHCVGAPLALAAPTTPQHYLVRVPSVTVGARLDGTFYPRSVNKYADGVPGGDGLDCWCRLPSEVVDWRTYASHRDAVIAAFAWRTAMLGLQAHADAAFAAATQTSAHAAITNGGLAEQASSTRASWLYLLLPTLVALLIK